jgi:hypothetical protein
VTQQTIITTPANTGAGDSPKSAFDKVNANFTDLYTQVGAIPISVVSYGADPTGVADSTAAIQAADNAATAAGAALYFPAGTYKIAIPASAAITGGGCPWLGAGRGVSILKSAAGAWPAASKMVLWNGKITFSVEQMGFDFSLATGPTGSTCWFLLPFNCNNYEIIDCAFTGIGTYMLGVYMNGGTGGVVKGCYFNQPTPTINQSQAINVQLGTTNYQIVNNVCIGTGIYSSGAYGLFEGNVVSGWKFGSGIVLGTPPVYLPGCRVIGNVCVNGAGAPDVNNTYSNGIECWAQNAVVLGNYCSGNVGAGITASGVGTQVVGNQCINNGSAGTSTGIQVYGIPASGTEHLVVTGNLCTDNQVSKTQAYGYKENGNGVTTLNATISGVAITGTAGQFNFASLSSTNLTAGTQVLISGTFGGTGSISGYNNTPTAYLVSATNGTSTFTLTTLAGAALTTTAGTPTGLTYNYAFLQGALVYGNDFSGNLTADTLISGANPLNNVHFSNAGFKQVALTDNLSNLAAELALLGNTTLRVRNSSNDHMELTDGTNVWGISINGSALRLAGLGGTTANVQLNSPLLLNVGAAAAAVTAGTAIGGTTQTTVGAAGVAAALPANPLGYITAYVGSTKIAIPYYNG